MIKMRSDAMTSGKCVRVRREGRREGREKGEGRKRGGENAWNSTVSNQLMQNFLAGTLAPQLPHLTLLLMLSEAEGEDEGAKDLSEARATHSDSDGHSRRHDRN